MNSIKASGSQIFTNLDLLMPSQSANVMAALTLRDIGSDVANKSVVQYRKTVESSYKKSSGQARSSNIRQDVAFCELLHGVAEITYSVSACLQRLMRWYPKPLRLPKKVSNEVPDGHSAAGKGELGITHLKKALLSK